MRCPVAVGKHQCVNSVGHSGTCEAQAEEYAHLSGREVKAALERLDSRLSDLTKAVRELEKRP